MSKEHTYNIHKQTERTHQFSNVIINIQECSKIYIMKNARECRKKGDRQRKIVVY